MNGLFASGLLFSESVIERLGWVLIHSLWQFALIGLLSVAALGVMRRKTSEARYAVLVGLMALLFVFPVATWMLQPNRSAVVSSASTAVQSQLESPYSGASALDNSIVDETNSDGPVVDASVDRPAALDPSSTSSDQEPASTISANSKARSVAARSQSTWIGQATAIMRPWLGWMVFCWGIGVMLCLLRPLLGWLTLRRLRRVGVWTASPEIRASLARVSEQMGLRQTVRVMESSLAHVPMVIGYLRPVILLPISLLTNIPATQLESILAHELAHIRRHDFIANLLQVLIETLFFYHPAVWWLSHRIRVEREHCCDDMVVKIIDDRTEYGRALIAIEELSGQSTVLSLGASDGSLLQRVRRISERPVDRSGVSAWTTFCLIASLVGFVFFLSLMEHGGVAAMDANNRNDDPQPLRSLDDDEFETAAHPASDELEFLAGHPKLKELTLEMTEQQFLAIVKRNDLNPKKTIVGGGSHYLIPADDDHRVIVMFGTGGDKCSGIQRVRADNRPSDITTLREPAFRLPGHSNMVCVDFDNNDTELVAVSTYHYATIRRWDLVEKKLINDVMLSSDKHLRPFRQGTFRLSGDEKRVIAATDEFVGIWDTTTGELLKKLPFPKKEWEYDCISKLDCTPDLSVIVGHLTTSYSRFTQGYDARVIVWDGDSGDAGRIITDKLATELKAIDLSRDGKLLATTNGGGAKVWETSTGKMLRYIPNDNSDRKDVNPEIKPRNSNVWSIQFSPDGKQLAVGDTLGVKLWNTQSGELLHQIDAPYRYGQPIFVFSKDGRQFARVGSRAEGKGKVVPIWSTQTGQQLFEIHTEAVSGAFSDDGSRFAVGLSDRKIALAVWHLTGKASDEDLAFEPVPEPLKDKVEAGTHYRGESAESFVDKYKPTWSEKQLGFQVGIAFTTPQRRFRAGQRVPLAVFFRNVGDKPQQLDQRPDFHWKTPNLVNANGEAIDFEKVPLLGKTSHYRDLLQPGEAYGPLYFNFGLGENPRSGKRHWSPYYKTPMPGKYKLTHTLSFDVAEPDGGDTSLKEEWKHGEIDSGTLEFEIVAGGQPANKSAAAIVENETIALADAVRDFNAENKQLDRGLDQPPLTEDEVIAAIKQSDRKRDAPKRVSEREFAAFKAVADSRRLPKDSYIKVWTTEEPTPLTVIHKWEVRLFMPAQDSDGFVNFRLRNKKRDEQQIDPNSIAWGPPDPDGLSLGLFLLPKKDVYKIGDRVRLRLFVRNDGSKAVEDMTFQNITWPGPKDFTVTDQTGKEIKVRNCHDEWSGAMWIAGAIGGGLSPSDVHSFRIPFELAIGGDKPNKLVGRVVEAKLGQSLQLKIRARNGSGRVRAEDEPVPESGNVTFKVAED